VCLPCAHAILAGACLQTQELVFVYEEQCLCRFRVNSCRFSVVCSLFVVYWRCCADKLRDGAKKTLLELGVKEEDIVEFVVRLCFSKERRRGKATVMRGRQTGRTDRGFGAQKRMVDGARWSMGLEIGEGDERWLVGRAPWDGGAVSGTSVHPDPGA